MLILLSSIFFYLLSRKRGWLLWLVLPFSFFFDIWKIETLGLSGLKILLGVFVFYLIFGKETRENSSGRRLKIG